MPQPFPLCAAHRSTRPPELGQTALGTTRSMWLSNHKDLMFHMPRVTWNSCCKSDNLQMHNLSLNTSCYSLTPAQCPPCTCWRCCHYLLLLSHVHTFLRCHPWPVCLGSPPQPGDSLEQLQQQAVASIAHCQLRHAAEEQCLLAQHGCMASAWLCVDLTGCNMRASGDQDVLPAPPAEPDVTETCP